MATKEITSLGDLNEKTKDVFAILKEQGDEALTGTKVKEDISAIIEYVRQQGPWCIQHLRHTILGSHGVLARPDLEEDFQRVNPRIFRIISNMQRAFKDSHRRKLEFFSEKGMMMMQSAEFYYIRSRSLLGVLLSLFREPPRQDTVDILEKGGSKRLTVGGNGELSYTDVNN